MSQEIDLSQPIPTESAVPWAKPTEHLEIGVAMVDGKVVMRFTELIQWFDMEPQLAIAIAESLITNAEAAADFKRLYPNGVNK